MTSPFTLTTHLLETQKPLYESATQHPFLLSAAKGTLPKQVLSKWLSNDRLYIHSYIRAGGKLLESIELPSAGTESFEARLVDWVIEALAAVRREERLFVDVADRYDLDLEMEPRVGVGSLSSELPGLRMIRGLFGTVSISTTQKSTLGGMEVIQGFLGAVTGNTNNSAVNKRETNTPGPAAPLLPWLEGALTFWGTERCYLDAWSWAKAQQPSGGNSRDDADGGALRKEFIPNWSSEEFANFVERLGKLIDEAVGQEIENAGEEGESVKTKILERVEGRWKTLLEGEKAFWPEV
ncbi:putative bifunctional TENA-E protein [Podospora australis]|uniref:Bifunctional TENA-E protein n=1 Tax=Podospora australis TaxID=1536484 RepID=A0AAN6WI80_9PEZI|nr:putative bifunctional TENA-E protein [Podospora australis]